MHKSKKKILTLIKLLIEIKANDNDRELREEYLLQIENFLNNSKGMLVRDDLELFRKEFQRFIKFVSMKWGSESVLHIISTRILYLVESLYSQASDESTGELSDLCREWDNANAIYRPDKQALDYASQIIYETVISKKA